MKMYVLLVSIMWMQMKIGFAFLVFRHWLYDQSLRSWILPWQHDYFHLEKIAEEEGGFVMIATLLEGIIVMCGVGLSLFVLCEICAAIHTLTVPLVSQTTALLIGASFLLAVALWLLCYFITYVRKTATE